MTRRLRGLAPPLRYAVYAAGVLLAFFVSIGLGATVALVVGSSPEVGSAEPSQDLSSVGTTSGGSGGAEGTKLENPEGPAEGASFVHTATDGNSRGDYTILSDPRINGDPDAVVLAEPAGSYERNIGVWYVPGKNKWAIFNQDLAAVPAEATFEVTVPPADEGFVHRAGPADTFGNVAHLDDPLLNGRPDADVSVTQNWNPGGGGGVYNDHPVGVRYDEDAGRWFVYNEDGAPMPRRAAFNVAVSGEPG